MTLKPPDSNHHTFLPALIRSVAPDTFAVAMWVEFVKRRNPGLSEHQIAADLSRRIVRNYGIQGAAIALPGAVPGVGTLAQVAIQAGTLGTDMALTLRAQAFVTFVVGHCYGVTDLDRLVEETLVCLALWTGAAVLTRRGTVFLGTLTAENVATKSVSNEVVKSIGEAGGRKVLTTLSSQRTGAALLSLIPLGVGAVLGGALNYFTLKGYRTAVLAYFGKAAAAADLAVQHR